VTPSNRPPHHRKSDSSGPRRADSPGRESGSSPPPPADSPDRESSSSAHHPRDVVGELREQAERAIRRERAQRAAPEVVAHGTLRRIEIETRPLVLAADDGTTWELLFPPSWQVEVADGARVTVHGDRADDVSTTAMVGPILRVRTLSTD
jgi:hypothetical protein